MRYHVAGISWRAVGWSALAVAGWLIRMAFALLHALFVGYGIVAALVVLAIWRSHPEQVSPDMMFFAQTGSAAAVAIGLAFLALTWPAWVRR